MSKTTYIFALPDSVQAEIRDALRARGLSHEDVERGMDGKLCDLEDTVDIGRWL